MTDDAASDMVPLSSVIDANKVNFVDQQVPSDLAAVIRRQKLPFKTKAQIANDPNHTHASKAATQLAEDRAIWMLVGMFVGFKAEAEGYTDCPPMTKTDYEILTSRAFGEI